MALTPIYTRNPHNQESLDTKEGTYRMVAGVVDELNNKNPPPQTEKKGSLPSPPSAPPWDNSPEEPSPPLSPLTKGNSGWAIPEVRDSSPQALGSCWYA